MIFFFLRDEILGLQRVQKFLSGIATPSIEAEMQLEVILVLSHLSVHKMTLGIVETQFWFFSDFGYFPPYT